VALLAAACTREPPPELVDPGRGSPSPTATVRVAVLRPGSDPDFIVRILPAEQGLRLAFDEGAAAPGVAVEVEPVDVGAPPEEVAREIGELAADPGVVAVVLGPGWRPPAELLASLEGAGFGTVSLTPLGAPPAGEAGAWRRLVAPLGAEGRALAGLLRELPVARDGVCLAGDGREGPEGAGRVARRIRRELGGAVPVRRLPGADPPAALVARVATVGCGAVVWLGRAEGAAALRRTLSEQGLRSVLLLGTDRVKDPRFAELAGALGEGTVVACPCADLSLSTEPRALRFIHAYAEAFGAAPGIFAVEGFDAGRLLLRAIAEGGPSRAGVARALAGIGVHEGLGGVYRFGPDGELLGPGVRLYRDEGGRWVGWPGP
jgi:branched-chain amino acid transport system substrate-binding protein